MTATWIDVIVPQGDTTQRDRERRRKQRIRAHHKERMRQLRAMDRDAWRSEP